MKFEFSPLPTFLFSLACFLFPTSHIQSAEAIEIGKDNFDLLPRGKEADGIIGDFLLRNDTIEVVVSGNLPLRRANMGVFYGDGNETPGVIYDVTKRGTNNDQITVFTPCGQKGPVNFVRIVESGADGRAVIETLVSSAKSGGLYKQHLYILEDGWDGVLVVTTLRNESGQKQIQAVWDGWTQMRSKGNVNGIDWADSIDPADKCGYAFAWVKEEGADTIPKQRDLELNIGDEAVLARFFAVGSSPAEAVGMVAARRNSGQTGTLSATLLDDSGQPAATSRIVIDLGGAKGKVPAYPDENGKLSIQLPAGEYPITIEDTGRQTVTDKIAIKAGKSTPMDLKLSKQAAVNFSVKDEAGVSIPCKVQFNPIEGTPAPNLGPTDRAHGCVDQWHSGTGDFRAPLPPGKYEVIVTRGIEYSHHAQNIDLQPGQEITIETTLKRLVQTPGWISADYHNHSTPSGDNTCGTDDRLINLAAEHIEFAPTTEHNRLYDWAPHINKLGLAPFLKTVPGMELTGRGAHFNCFPLKPEPTKQDGGAPVWKKDPRLNAITLRNWQGEEPDRWIHLNHPDMAENFVDWNRDGRADGGYAYFGGMLDGLESQNYSNSSILANAPYSIGKARTGLGSQVNYIREFIWLQLLNQGMTVWGIGVADAHHVHGNGVGSWRTYVPSQT
ncbi:MAG: carboxypeptidase regulatory-like domain-containing protein, partial [Verrucomicrobiales bacterium]|nr:carboxypeptidase regulatory-like domain-containing protein [Verrucomicrobiales bacterium]